MINPKAITISTDGFFTIILRKVIDRGSGPSSTDPRLDEKGSAVVTMQNAGNISMVIDVSVRCFDSESGRKMAVGEDQPLKVWPAKVVVGPHQKTKDIIIKFIPSKEYHKSAPCRGIALLKVEPSGPTFEIDVTAFNPNAVQPSAVSKATVSDVVTSKSASTSAPDTLGSGVSSSTTAPTPASLTSSASSTASSTSSSTASSTASSTTSSTASSSKDVGLLANKHYLAWSGVALGESQSLTLTLKNPNAEVDMRVSLEVRMNPSEDGGRQQQQQTAFWIPTVSPKDESQQLVDRKEIIISRKEEYPLRVIFAPKSVVNFGAKLVIKTLSGVRRKFSIPLLGYGGSAVLGLEAERGGGGGLMSKERFLNVYGRGKRGGCADFMSDETSWVMPLSDPSSSTRNAGRPSSRNVVVKCSITNSGTRTGFVCARLFKDEALRTKIDGGDAAGVNAASAASFHVEPNEFVLGVGETQSLTVIWRGSASASTASSIPLGFLALFHGDEVMRTRLKKIVGESAMPLAKLPASVRPCLAEINFASSFHNESRLSASDKSLQQGPSDLKLFFNSVANTCVALIRVDEALGRDEADDLKQKMSDLTFDETFRPLEESINLCTPAVNHKSSAKMGGDVDRPCWDLFPRHDDVPTRDNFDSSSNPRIPGVYPGITSSAGFGAESHSVVYGDGAVGGGGGAGAVGIPGAAWSVMPESFSFNLNEQSASVLSTKKLVKIVNMGPKPLSFELSVPGHALLATPDYGVVASLSSLAVSVGVNKAAFEREANKRNGIVIPWTGSLYVNGDDGATVAVKVFIKNEASVLKDGGSAEITKSDVISSNGAFSAASNGAITAIQDQDPDLHSSQTRLVLGDSSSSTFSELSFPSTAVDSASDALLILKNGRQASLRWRLTTFAPPYLKATSRDSESKQKAAESKQKAAPADRDKQVFRVVVSSGVLKADGEARVLVMFSPSDSGIYLQSWELLGIPDDGGPRVNLRVQMVGEAAFTDNRFTVGMQQQETMQQQILGKSSFPEGRRSVAAVAPTVSTKDKNASSSNATNSAVNSSSSNATSNASAAASVAPSSSFIAGIVAPSSDSASVKTSKVGGQKKKSLQNVTLKDQRLEFPPTERGRTSQVKLIIRNHAHEERQVKILRVAEPFFIRQKHLNITIKPRSFLGVPIEFCPPEKGTFSTNVVVNVSANDTAIAAITGSCL